MIVVGLISGTSHDGIDGAAVELSTDGDCLRGRVLASSTLPYPPALRERLVAALPPSPTCVGDVCRLDSELGDAFAAAVGAVAGRLPAGRRADLVCSHGQTVFHGVEDGRAWGTLQLGQPARIAEATGLPVVGDLRSRDVAAGGLGAPLASILDVLALAGADGPARGGPVAALNLGGIANMTVARPGGEPLAYDLGPANALIDAAMLAATEGRASLDEDGRTAARGAVDDALLERLLAEPYYAVAPPKATGKELFNADYLERRASGTKGADLVATVTALTAEVVARELRRHRCARALVSGGGVRNATLMAAIAARLPEVEIETTAALGLPPDDKEAIAFALIGWLTAHGLPGSLGSCTGARGARVLGSLTPGARALVLPPRVAMPARLVMEAA